MRHASDGYTYLNKSRCCKRDYQLVRSARRKTKEFIAQRLFRMISVKYTADQEKATGRG